jgi:hypothetical protein
VRLRRRWKTNAEQRASFRAVRGTHFAMVEIRDRAHDREAKATPGTVMGPCARLVNAVKALKNAFKIGWREARPRIRNTDLDFIAPSIDPHRHQATVGSEPDRVF